MRLNGPRRAPLRVALALLFLLAPATAGGAAGPGVWQPTGSMDVGRAYHTASLLHDGSVLVVGGEYALVHPLMAEIYDPGSGAWRPLRMTGRLHAQGHSATMLRDGRVLIIGGGAADIYDPWGGGWYPTGPLPAGTVDVGSTVTVLADGRVLVAGGGLDWHATAASAVLDPRTRTWRAVGNMTVPRYDHTATLLADGTVLVLGGTAEVYDPP